MMTWVRAALAIGAAAVSLFFIGFNVEILCLTLALLAVWLAAAVWQSCDTGLQIPRSLLAVTLFVYPLWLGLTLLWNPVSTSGQVTFWWMVVWPLVFWIAILDPRREQVWPRAGMLALYMGVGLALIGFYQRFVFMEAPSGPFLDRNIYAALLTMIAFLLAGNFLGMPGSKRHLAWFAMAFFVLSLAIVLTQGRAAMLTYAACVVVLAVTGWSRNRTRRLAILGVTALSAFLLANLIWDGALTERLATLENPDQAGHNRFLIWEGTWRMIADHFWSGVGLVMYPLLWPPYRLPEDDSGGYFAHNDYMQIWVDAGLPGLILFLAVLGAAAWMLLRLWRKTAAGSAARAEVAGLAASFMVLPINSVFNYNFYVVPSLVVFGMLLARIHMLHESFGGGERIVLPLSRFLGARALRTIIFLLALFPLVYFGSVAAATMLTDRAIIHARRSEYEAADMNLALAHRMLPGADSILMLRADLYGHLLAESQSDDTGKRVELFTAARDMLEQAEQLNPFRARIFLVRADLLRQNPDLAQADWREAVERDYRRALELDPWYYQARYRFAGYLFEQGAKEQARSVLEAGIAHAPRAKREENIPYLLLTAHLREQTGNIEGAATLRQLAKDIAAEVRTARLLRRDKEKLMPHRLLLSYF